MMLGIDDLRISGAIVEAAACAPQVAHDSNEEDFLRTAESCWTMVWTADGSGLCTFASRSWLEFRGRTLEQETGAGWAEGMHPDDALGALTSYWQAVRSRRPVRIEYRILAKDRSYHHVERFGVACGDGYVGCVTPLRDTNSFDPDHRRQLDCLSARERQVLELIVLGRSTRQIAETLGISYKTADSHRTHLLKKLGIHETASLVRFAIRAGVVAA